VCTPAPPKGAHQKGKGKTSVRKKARKKPPGKNPIAGPPNKTPKVVEKKMANPKPPFGKKKRWRLRNPNAPGKWKTPMWVPKE